VLSPNILVLIYCESDKRISGTEIGPETNGVLRRPAATTRNILSEILSCVLFEKFHLFDQINLVVRKEQNSRKVKEDSA